MQTKTEKKAQLFLFKCWQNLKDLNAGNTVSIAKKIYRRKKEKKTKATTVCVEMLTEPEQVKCLSDGR